MPFFFIIRGQMELVANILILETFNIFFFLLLLRRPADCSRNTNNNSDYRKSDDNGSATIFFSRFHFLLCWNHEAWDISPHSVKWNTNCALCLKKWLGCKRIHCTRLSGDAWRCSFTLAGGYWCLMVLVAVPLCLFVLLGGS